MSVAAETARPVERAHWADRLAEAIGRKRSQLVVGLDPRLDLLPVELRGEALGRAEALRTRRGSAAGSSTPSRRTPSPSSPSSPSSRRSAPTGCARSRSVCATRARPGCSCIADGKRGDIGSTARAYAAAYLEPRGDEPPLADALTVNAYLGRDSLEPFLAACRRARRRLLLPREDVERGRRDIQDLTLSDGRPLWHHVAGSSREWGADLVGERGLSRVGAVVGATHPRAVGEARRLMPQAVLLLPGVGAQGATPGRPRARVHERPGERARRRVPLGHLRLPRPGGRLARAAAAEAARLAPRDLGGVRLVARTARRLAAPGRAAAAAIVVGCSAARALAYATMRAARRQPPAPPPTTPRRPPPPPARPPRVCRPPAPATRYYVDRAGDTLGAIAATHGTTVERAAGR